MIESLDHIKSRIKIKEITYNNRKVCNVAPAVRMLLMQEHMTSIIVFKTNSIIIEYIKDSRIFLSLFDDINKLPEIASSFTPLYISSHHNLEDISREILEFISQKQQKPVIIAIEDLGLFSWAESKEQADLRMSMLSDIMLIKSFYAHRKDSHKSDAEAGQIQDYLISFNYTEKKIRESYKNQHKKLNGKIIIITGAAQGFGKGIADALASEGAHIILADIIEEKAKENAAALCKEFGKGKAIGVKTDVTDEHSIENLIFKTVTEFGGLDVFISNAGILRAGSLEDMDLNTFELVTKVNYTAFYLCTKYAASVFKIQAAYNKNYFTDIIQINSKSGLAGSKNNFAYSGGKFGSIGLLQSFALELVDYNIKVNAICPGNFFEGPLWSDPEKGLFIQYLKAEKVPGAKTIEDVKRFYENKVPMKRGCTVSDVVKVVYYIIEQEYETGQAIPVTGGQIMLK